MSTDLKIQIREYAARVESGQTPVTVDEVRLLIEERDGTDPVVGWRPSRRRTSMRRPWSALVAAVVLLLLFGALALLLPPGEPVPPADSLPPPLEQSGYYTTSAVPEGFVLQDVQAFGWGAFVYLHMSDGSWIPTDGGFAVHGIRGRPFAVPEDPDDYLDATLEAVPGSTEVDISGRRGILHEIEFRQDDLTAPLTWVLGADDRGGVFEVVAVGMSREAVVAVAEGVRRVSLDEFVTLGEELTWDVRVGVNHNGFGYSPPSRVTDLADDVDVAVGVDLLFSRLAMAGEESTVITTDDGEIVETLGQAIRSTSAALYLRGVPPDDEDAVFAAYPWSSELSPARRGARIDRYVEQLAGGEVLSEEPYVIQAPPGPEPRFDVSGLGEELPLVPATSPEVVPESLFEGAVGIVGLDTAPATPDRPVVVLGTVSQPGSQRTPETTVMIWFTESGFTCEGTASGDGQGSSCGSEVLRSFGQTGESYSSEGIGEISYTVPLETAVVQIVTELQTFWQRPVAGYGLVPYGDTVERPTELVAYDVDGAEIGRWDVEGR